MNIVDNPVARVQACNICRCTYLFINIIHDTKAIDDLKHSYSFEFSHVDDNPQ